MDQAVESCSEAPPCLGGAPDLTWLLHRAAHRMGSELDRVAVAHGLANARDWVVLGALLDQPARTQLALAGDLGVDKTTLTSLLDRLERDGLVVRRLSATDRRARIPEATAAGRTVQAAVSADRDRVEAEALASFTPGERDVLRELLHRLAQAETTPPGSCMR